MRDQKQFKYKVVFHYSGAATKDGKAQTRSFKVENIFKVMWLMLTWTTKKQVYKIHVTKLKITQKYYESQQRNIQN